MAKDPRVVSRTRMLYPEPDLTREEGTWQKVTLPGLMFNSFDRKGINFTVG